MEGVKNKEVKSAIGGRDDINAQVKGGDGK